MQHLSEITAHAVDLSGFGLNPQGLPLFRVVWSPTRTEKFYDRETFELRTIRLYTFDAWVLERWLSPQEYAGTKRQHDEQQALQPISMEYPSEGEYCECMQFPNNEAVSMAYSACQWLIYGKVAFSDKDRALAIKLREAKKKKASKEFVKEAVRDRIGVTEWKGERVKLYDANGRYIN